MSKKAPPVPPAGRTNKGPAGSEARDPSADKTGSKVPENAASPDRQENIEQNTTNQGYQQDR